MQDVTYSWSITSLCCICSRIFDSVRIVSVAQRWGFYHLYCQYLHIVFIWLYTKCFFYLSLPLHLIVSVSGCSIHYFLFWSAKLVKLIRENHPVYIYILFAEQSHFLSFLALQQFCEFVTHDLNITKVIKYCCNIILMCGKGIPLLYQYHELDITSVIYGCKCSLIPVSSSKCGYKNIHA